MRMTYVGEVGRWLACRTCHQGQLGRTSLRARTTGSLGPGTSTWEKRATGAIFVWVEMAALPRTAFTFLLITFLISKTNSVPPLHFRQENSGQRYYMLKILSLNTLHIAEFSNLLMFTRSEEGVSTSRQFSPDPFINVGFIAFMAAMGLDLVYKVTRTLSYFDESE